MKELSFARMEEVAGGKDYTEELCGAAVAVAIFATGGWAIFGAAAALAICLSGDTRQ